jgi:nitrate/nitrite-specific signal transduction histidine kinase
MGQKRTQNIIDEKIGQYLADFEQEVLTKIERRFIARINELDKREEQILSEFNNLKKWSKQIRDYVKDFEQMNGMAVIVSAAVAGAVSAVLVLAVVALILWLTGVI